MLADDVVEVFRLLSSKSNCPSLALSLLLNRSARRTLAAAAVDLWTVFDDPFSGGDGDSVLADGCSLLIVIDGLELRCADDDDDDE